MTRGYGLQLVVFKQDHIPLAPRPERVSADLLSFSGSVSDSGIVALKDAYASAKLEVSVDGPKRVRAAKFQYIEVAADLEKQQVCRIKDPGCPRLIHAR